MSALGPIVATVFGDLRRLSRHRVLEFCAQMAVAAIDELGVELEREWAVVDYELAAFPEICASRLQGARLPARIDADDVVRAVFAGGLPQQVDPDARFGQPPVTLYRAPRFYIDALFWVDGTTTIHDHAFSGAFQVLAGQSIENDILFCALTRRGWPHAVG